MHQHDRVDGYDRIREHAASTTNERVDQEMGANLELAARDPDFADRRLEELDREWDLDRTILLGFAAAGSVALALGLAGNRKWRFPLTAQIGFLLAHSLVGWCPPAAVLRHLGFRTRQEIESERHALLSIREHAARDELSFATGL